MSSKDVIFLGSEKSFPETINVQPHFQKKKQKVYY